MPPQATIMSLATPRAGLAVMPLLPSEPPQLVPRMISLAGTVSRRSVDPRQHLGDELYAGLDRLRRAAEVLHH